MRLCADSVIVRVARIAKAWSSFFMVSPLRVKARGISDQMEKHLNRVRCSEDETMAVEPEVRVHV